MRKYLLLPVLAICLTIFSCEKLSEITQFNLNYTASVTVPATAGIDLPFDLFTPDIETNTEQEFETERTSKDLLEEVKLTKLDLVITDPTDEDFSFLESITVFLEAEGLPEIAIATLDPIPAEPGSELSLVVIEDDLKDYIKKDGFKLRANIKTDETLSQAIKIDVNTSFFIDARILGQ
ncbi:MAG: hypothetical protein AAFQ68_19165 [Bacteroidota bacterium]